MKVVIRVDASIELGSGHVMRCLTLAEELQNLQYTVEFICRKSKGSMEQFIQSKGFKVHLLPEVKFSLWKWTRNNWKIDAQDCRNYLMNKRVDLLIVDHYAIDIKWETVMRSITNKIMVIDDLANRVHDCDILLDHNAYKDKDNRYKNLIYSKSTYLLGPQFALLRKEFFHKEKTLIKNRILITFGGSDPTNETLKVLDIISNLPKKNKIRVVVGGSNPNKKEVYEYIKKYSNMTFLFNIDNMAEEINKCRFVIGAGGVSALERVALNTPALVIGVASNQIEIAKNLDEQGAIKYIGFHNQQYKDKLLKYTNELLCDKSQLINQMIESTKKIIGPENTTAKVAKVIKELI